MTEWQPIETAPKDGRWILTWTTDISHAFSPYLVVRWKGNEWCYEAGKDFFAPTHWTPLPEPPKE